MKCLFSLVLLLGLSGSPVPEPGAPALKGPGIAQVGEKLIYAAGMGVIEEAAVLTIETLPLPGNDRQAGHRLLAMVQPGALVSTFYTFSYRHISTVRVPELTPRSASRQVREGDKQSFVAFNYHHDEGYVGLSESATGDDQARDPITADAHDMLSAIFHLRGVDPSAGSTFTVYENRDLYRLSFAAPTTEMIEVPAGTFDAWHYVLQVEPAGDTLTKPEIHVWIEKNPARRLPLRISATTTFGELSLALRSSDDPSSRGASNPSTTGH